jgi:hypothetical protein
MKRRRTALTLLAVLALLAGGVTASAHSPGPTGVAIPDPADGRIHSCYQDILPIDRTLRLVTSMESCLLTIAVGAIPIVTLPIENGVDWPANGVLTQLTESAPVSVNFTGNPAGTAVISCAPKQAIGVTFSSPAPAAPIVLTGITRGGALAGTELTATFYNFGGGAPTIHPRALCVTAFAQ